MPVVVVVVKVVVVLDEVDVEVGGSVVLCTSNFVWLTLPESFITIISRSC